LVPDLASGTMRRSLRLASGLVLFTYITAHLINHALGLISLKTAEAALEFAVEVWSSPLGTVLLYGAFAIHFVLALWSVYERRTFRLPPLELLRIALGEVALRPPSQGQFDCAEDLMLALPGALEPRLEAALEPFVASPSQRLRELATSSLASRTA